MDLIDKIKETGSSAIRVAITDIDGVLRGKYMHIDKFKSALESGFGFCDVVFGWDVADVAYDNAKVTGWHTGYPDADATIVPASFRTIPWNNDLPFLLADFSQSQHPACPRSLLKQIHKQAQKMELEPIFSQEFEWFNFDQTPEEWQEKGFQNPTPLTPGMFGYSLLRSSQKKEFFNDLFFQLEAFGIPLEGLHTETGPGVYEAAIRYSDIITAADRAVLFKSAVKELASEHGIMATFMAKWKMELPGCSGHVHQSLWRDGKNLFFEANEPNKMSDLMKSYIAGQLLCLPEILPMFAPTINSYKRLVEGAWAPTTVTWGIDNRTTAIRVLPLGEKSARIESRVVGSDVNPYLAMSACLASGLYGVKNNLSLDVPATIGNGYENFSNGILPKSLEHATAVMKNSAIAKELFGEPFVDHFVRTREWEVKKYAEHVTDWELKRYFETI